MGDTEGDPERDKWLKSLFAKSIPSTPFFRMALAEIEQNGETLVPGSVWDDPTTTNTNILFMNCKSRGYVGQALTSIEPKGKKAIFLCEETFEPLWKREKYEEMINIITHEMIHWIDRHRSLLSNTGSFLYRKHSHYTRVFVW